MQRTWRDHWLFARWTHVAAEAVPEDDEVPAEGAASRLAGFADANERAIAEYLESRGRKVTKRPGGAMAGEVHGGDAQVDGLPHEFRTLQAGASASTVVNMVNNCLRRGSKARRIVIDSRGTGLRQAEAQAGAARALDASREGIDYVAVIGGDFFVGHSHG